MESPQSNGHRGPAAANGGYPDGAAAQQAALTGAQWAALELIRHTRSLRKYWYLVIGATIAVSLFVGIRDKYFSVKWYRAQAVIMPVSPDASLASSIGMGSSGPGGGGVMSLLSLGGESDNAMIAEQYIAIMNSYAFTTALISHYHLLRKIVPTSTGHVPHLSPWAQHTEITSRFQTSYDYKSGNLNLYFIDPDPVQARQILGYYLESLRDKVRNEEVNGAAAAVGSLEDEIRKTSDALLQNQLYELVARQIEREKISQVQADFAFKVIEPPVVPDQYYAPQARRSAEFAAVLTFIVLGGVIAVFDFVRRARAQYLALEQAHQLPALATEPAAPRSAQPSAPRAGQPPGTA
jgi:hypothetical protein